MRPRDIESGLTAERLRSLVSYDKETGLFTWLKSGAVAGWLENTGYIRIKIYGRSFVAHRLAWLWMMGEWPEERIDHRDLDYSNNRWDNLRPATNSLNSANRSVMSNNELGIKGVRHHECGKFVARICVNGKPRYLGLFDNPDDARAKYSSEAIAAFGEFARQS